MTSKEIRQLNDKELHELSLQQYKKGKNKGKYTMEANLAYAERQRRAGVTGTLGVGKKKPNKFQADIDYYGSSCLEW